MLFEDTKALAEMMRFGWGASNELGRTARSYIGSKYQEKTGQILAADFEISPADVCNLITNTVVAAYQRPIEIAQQLVEEVPAGLKHLVAAWDGQNVAVQHFISAADVPGLPRNAAQILMRASTQYDLKNAVFFSKAIPQSPTRYQVKIRKFYSGWEAVPSGSEPVSRNRESYTAYFGTERLGEALTYDSDVMAGGAADEFEADAQDFVNGAYVAVSERRDRTLVAQGLANQTAPDTTGTTLLQRQFRTIWNAYYSLKTELAKWGKGNVPIYFYASDRDWGLTFMAVMNYFQSGGSEVRSPILSPSAAQLPFDIIPLWTDSELVRVNGPFLVAQFGHYSCLPYDRKVLPVETNPWTLESGVVGWIRFGCTSFPFVTKVQVPTV